MPVFAKLSLLGETMPTGEFVETHGTEQQVRSCAESHCFDYLNLLRQHELGGKDVLFYIERNVNRNTCVYKANRLANGQLNTDQPVEVYWVMFPTSASEKAKTETKTETKQNKKYVSDSDSDSDADDNPLHQPGVWTEPLLMVENSIGYGVSVKPPAPTAVAANIEIQACKGMPIHIVYEPSRDSYVAVAVLDGKRYCLQSIMIYTKPQTILPWPRAVQMDICVLDTDQLPHQFYYKI